MAVECRHKLPIYRTGNAPAFVHESRVEIDAAAPARNMASTSEPPKTPPLPLIGMRPRAIRAERSTFARAVAWIALPCRVPCPVPSFGSAIGRPPPLETGDARRDAALDQLGKPIGRLRGVVGHPHHGGRLMPRDPIEHVGQKLQLIDQPPVSSCSGTSD